MRHRRKPFASALLAVVLLAGIGSTMAGPASAQETAAPSGLLASLGITPPRALSEAELDRKVIIGSILSLLIFSGLVVFARSSASRHQRESRDI